MVFDVADVFHLLYSLLQRSELAEPVPVRIPDICWFERAVQTVRICVNGRKMIRECKKMSIFAVV